MEKIGLQHEVLLVNFTYHFQTGFIGCYGALYTLQCSYEHPKVSALTISDAIAVLIHPSPKHSPGPSRAESER